MSWLARYAKAGCFMTDVKCARALLDAASRPWIPAFAGMTVRALRE